jgi:hypothetical protein
MHDVGLHTPHRCWWYWTKHLASVAIVQEANPRHGIAEISRGTAIFYASTPHIRPPKQEEISKLFNQSYRKGQCQNTKKCGSCVHYVLFLPCARFHSNESANC